MTKLPGRVAQAARSGGRVALALLATALSLVLMIADAGPAAAHPLGNFTMNRYARVEVSARVIRVYYVIDLAEIPSYQVRKLVDADPDGYLDREVADVIRGLELDLSGRPLELRASRRVLSRPRGEGGVRRVRIDAVLEASLPATTPDESRSRGDRFTSLLDRHDLSPVGVAGILCVAVLVGGGHALAPGHGKTVMAAYLVGTKGRPLDALLLGLIVSAMHTASVLAVGVGLLQVDRSFALDRLYPILTVASGVGVLVVGGWLATVRMRSFRSEDRPKGGRHLHHHGHRHGQGHRHGHGQGHGHGHGLAADVTPFSRRGLALLATAGGVVPSPSAVVVVVGSFSVGRIGLGLGLVLAFSIGLAATLTAVGLAFVLGGRALGHQPSTRLTRVFPVLGAMALLPLGLVLVIQGAGSLAG